jgi:hypothetical protein
LFPPTNDDTGQYRRSTIGGQASFGMKDDNKIGDFGDVDNFLRVLDVLDAVAISDPIENASSLSFVVPRIIGTASDTGTTSGGEGGVARSEVSLVVVVVVVTVSFVIDSDNDDLCSPTGSTSDALVGRTMG